ncbi:MAG: DUF2252 domain-containing protein [Pirellulales bacterium]|nr:DUF2252 domain-containing protein [Pirellulales bacterium]
MNPSLSIAARLEAGKALRKTVPRAAHADWVAATQERDPLELLSRRNQGRIADLVPLRYGRLLRNPFTFLRGSPGLMAHDLASTPTSGLRVQACGDCHLTNFGLFATPERNLVFDLNDFDETLPGPWEWDIKRLTTSFVVAARTSGISDQRARDTATRCARTYRQQLWEFAEMSPLEVWYYRIDVNELAELAPDTASRGRREKFAARARERTGENLYPKITEEHAGRQRFVDDPPLVQRLDEDSWRAPVEAGIEAYRASLPDDRRFVFDRYRLEDFALRVVGIGSVATRCYVALFYCDDRNPLLLQIKEARRSVLEPFAERSQYENEGQRVVVGQRLLQSASDIFLGWLRSADGHDYYVRQLRDMKFTPPVEDFSASQLGHYAEACGWALARAHARTGDAAMISGYLGRGERFDEVLGAFACGYADQIERDHAALTAAEQSGLISAVTGV